MPKPPAPATITRVVTYLTDEDLLHKHHLHTEDDCAREAEQVEARLAVVIGELHRQAHPGEHPRVMFCHLEPCRSLDTLEHWETGLA